MKRLKIGDTINIEINDCVRMRDTKRGFFLDITLPKENISMDELVNLLDGNTETIIIAEEDGTVNEYYGFKDLSNFSLENGIYHVCQSCTSEIEAQLSLAQNKIREQEEQLVNHATVITKQSNIIAAQEEQVAILANMSEAQLSTIDSILSEVVPNTINLAIMQAIEAVTASGAESEVTTGENTDVIEE